MIRGLLTSVESKRQQQHNDCVDGNEEPIPNSKYISGRHVKVSFRVWHGWLDSLLEFGADASVCTQPQK
jgi:hypothetical protein